MKSYLMLDRLLGYSRFGGVTLALVFLGSAAVLQAGAPPAATLEQAAFGPAVSEVNGKIEGFYGELNDSYSRGAAGSVSFPITHALGAQVDAIYNHTGESDFYGGGGHFFARRPEQGLIGLFAGGIYSSSSDQFAVALEGEYYLKNITFGAFAGYHYFDTDTILPAFNPGLANDNHFMIARVYAAFYPMDDLMVRLNYSNRLERNFYSVDLEYQTPVPGLALFVDAALGDSDYHHLLGGVRYYFGGSKSLKDRHRQDDPINPLGFMSQTGHLGELGDSNVPNAAAGGPPPPPPPPPP